MFNAPLPKVVELTPQAYTELKRRAEAAHVRPAELGYGILISYCVQHKTSIQNGALIISAHETNTHIVQVKHKGESTRT